jgi:hypothetical protein
MRVSLDPHSGMPAAAMVETERTGVPVVRNTLRGFCRARMPSGVVLHDNGVHEKNGTWWGGTLYLWKKQRSGRSTIMLQP